MFVSKIISGGQTGADRGGLDAAMELGIEHGGHCPRNRLAEDGVVPTIYQLIETESNDYRARTRLNVDNADITLLFTYGSEADGGTLFTQRYCIETKKPWFHLAFGILWPLEGNVEHARAMREKLTKLSIRLGRPLVVNVAGNRESKSPGIQKRTAELLYLACEDSDQLDAIENHLKKKERP